MRIDAFFQFLEIKRPFIKNGKAKNKRDDTKFLWPIVEFILYIFSEKLPSNEVKLFL